MNTIAIDTITKNKTIVFAAQELKKYALQMGNRVVPKHDDVFCFTLGTFEDLKIMSVYSKTQDEIHIEVNERKGVLSGANPRSVLFSMYRYLQECGCHFLYPGNAGEIVPITHFCNCNLQQIPSYLHRCVSIEGANSIDNVLAMIDWLPKVGMNSYHIQLENGYTFFERWFAHTHNPHKQSVPIDIVQTKAYITQMREHIKKRGLLLQYMGHGWTSESFGIKAFGWEKTKLTLDKKTRNMLALLKGKRQVWMDIPVNTNACYSQAIVRVKIVEYITLFCKKNKDVDMLHVWLADDHNNYCECFDCCKKLPSDWYVMILNELDTALISANLDTKIVFLVYSETLWPPQTEVIKNQNRFSMIFAPVSLNYTKSFQVHSEVKAPPPFILNNIKEPTSVEENIAFLKGWKKIFKGESFIYIYHLLSCGMDKDFSCFALAKNLHTDIQRFSDFELQGVSSCQAQRVSFPTGFCMYVLAKTLWDKEISFEALVNGYFLAAFGVQWQKAVDVLTCVEKLFPPEYLQHEMLRVSDDMVEKFRLAPIELHRCIICVDDCLQSAKGVNQTNWKYLSLFLKILQDCVPLFIAIAQGDEYKKKEQRKIFLSKLFLLEDDLQCVFDMEWFARNFELFQVRGLKYFVNHVQEGDENE